MDVGINLRNNGPYRIKIKGKKYKPFLWLTQFKTDKPSNIRFGPLKMISRETILQFNEDEVAHVIKCLMTEKDEINFIEIVVVKDY